MSHSLIHADLLAHLRGNRWLVQNGYIPKAHAILCDPPYGLEFMGKEWDRPKPSGTVLHDPSVVGGFQDGNGGNPFSRSRIRYGIGANDFQAWVSEWAELLIDYVYPGAVGMFFGGTRTYHRLAAGLEDAGWEIADCIMWVHGQGFPKSAAIDKLLDKTDKVNDDTERRRSAISSVIAHYREQKGLTRSEVSERVMGTPSGACWNWEFMQLPGVDQWPRIKAVLDIPDDYDALIDGDRAKWIEAERAVIGKERNWGKAQTVPISAYGEWDITAPATPLAARWEGYGTALKPAYEPCVMARAPRGKRTYAALTREFGTGALNIDGSRIGVEKKWDAQPSHDTTPASIAGRNVKPTDPARSASSATGNAVPTSNEKASPHPEATSKTDTECFDGLSPAERSASQSPYPDSNTTKYGKTPTGQFLPDTSSTTSTATNSTIDWKTSNSWNGDSIPHSTTETPRNTPTAERPQTTSEPTTTDPEYANVAPHGSVSIGASARWPANFALVCACESDEHAPDCPVAVLGAQSGETGNGYRANPSTTEASDGDLFWGKAHSWGERGHDDTGTAARFFYQAKAAAWEREAGLHDRARRNVNDGRSTPIDNPFQRGDTLRLNVHPTVKPIRLAEYLARLILPPELDTPRRLLVPFAGSGSEMIGALLAGWDVVTGIEREAEYVELARARVGWWAQFATYDEARAAYEKGRKAKPVVIPAPVVIADDKPAQLALFEEEAS